MQHDSHGEWSETAEPNKSQGLQKENEQMSHMTITTTTTTIAVGSAHK
jgi:hypothetical protein